MHVQEFSDGETGEEKVGEREREPPRERERQRQIPVIQEKRRSERIAKRETERRERERT